MRRFDSQLTGGLGEDSEFQDMMNGLKHMAKRWVKHLSPTEHEA